jgi:DNA primase large subunit
MTTTSSPAVDPAELLPGDLRVELWKRVERRLRKGEVLITNEQFFKAMAKDFKRMLRVEPDRRVKVELLQMPWSQWRGEG